MTPDNSVTRRSFLAAAASLAPAGLGAVRVPIGLELYSLRGTLPKDLKGPVTAETLAAVAKMGYQIVEFWSPYFSWTADDAREIRKVLDGLGIRCLSTHNAANAFSGDGISKAIELNSILGCRYVVMASPPRVTGLDGWKTVADLLNQAGEKFKTANLRPGYHNHQAEFKALEGTRPIDVLAQYTNKEVLLQFDVGTCVEVGQDPVAWIRKNPGRIGVIHLKDYAPPPGKGYRVLFGEGAAPWKEILAAAESVGGIEFYLIEQEGYDLPEIETVQRCLENYKKLRA